MSKAWETKVTSFDDQGMFNFRATMGAFLVKDLRALHQLVEKFGSYYHETYNADILMQLTLGLLAVRIWKGSLPTDVAKITNPALYAHIQQSSRGSLGPCDYTAKRGEAIYKVGVTSLHPQYIDASKIERPTSHRPTTKRFVDYNKPISH